MVNHHVDSYNFLVKLYQPLPYLDVHPKSSFKHNNHHQTCRRYNNRYSCVYSLIDVSLIPILENNEEIFLNVVDKNHDFFLS